MVASMSSTSRRSARSNDSTGLAGSRSTGSPRLRIGIATRRILQVGFGLDACDDAADGELADQLAEGADAVPLDGEQADGRVAERCRDQRDGV